ncbi:helix-turn-helix domain-containing protein [PVC group bacterium]|nr:helix-turn-helix domain-containing protein [PVC group bacterium]
MAKLFYTLEEACSKLGKSEEEVTQMAQSGQLDEMRDGDNVMFKREQVDLLAKSADGESGEIELDLTSGGSAFDLTLGDTGKNVSPDSDDSSDADAKESGYDLSGSGMGLAQSGSAAGLDLGSSGSASGIGFDLGDSGSAAGFDLGETGDATGFGSAFGEDDDSAETRVSDAVDEELSLESVGSGSGLLDLTRESDDTSLGAELLDEVWEGGDSGEFGASASGLFESSDGGEGEPKSAATSPSAPMGLAAPMMAEAYDGKWSGAGTGFMIGSFLALTIVLLMLVSSLAGVGPQLATMITADLMIWAGGLAGLAVVFGFVGMFIGKASE